MDSSFLAHLLSTEIDDKREEILSQSQDELVIDGLVTIGIFVYDVIEDTKDNTLQIVIASDGMPERAKDATYEVLRALGFSLEHAEWSATENGKVIILIDRLPDDEETE